MCSTVMPALCFHLRFSSRMITLFLYPIIFMEILHTLADCVSHTARSEMIWICLLIFFAVYVNAISLLFHHDSPFYSKRVIHISIYWGWVCHQCDVNVTEKVGINHSYLTPPPSSAGVPRIDS